MVLIADKYEGRYYFDSNSPTSNSLNDAFTRTPCGEDDDDENVDADILLFSTAGLIGTSNVTASVYIDSSLGRATKFIFDYELNRGYYPGLVLTLKSPSGRLITPGDPEYVVKKDYFSIFVAVNGIAEVGRWEFEMMNAVANRAQRYKVSVLSRARSDSTDGDDVKNLPIIVRSSVKSTGVTYPSPMVVYAEATKGGEPVIGMKVVALVDRPKINSGDSSKLFELELLDNGQGADSAADDGVYSRYFSAFTQIGRYSFSIRASDEYGTARVRTYTSPAESGGAPAFDEDNIRPMKPAEFVEEAVGGNVARATTAGASELRTEQHLVKEINKRLKMGVDEIPPAKITDLRVTETDFDAGDVTLTWTAPGDDYDAGNVSNYMIFILKDEESTNVTESLNVFTSAGDTVNATFNVQRPRCNERDTFDGKRGDKCGVNATFVIVVIAVDDNNNTSPESNRVTFGLGYVPDVVIAFGAGFYATKRAGTRRNKTGPGKVQTISVGYSNKE